MKPRGVRLVFVIKNCTEVSEGITVKTSSMCWGQVLELDFVGTLILPPLSFIFLHWVLVLDDVRLSIWRFRKKRILIILQKKKKKYFVWLKFVCKNFLKFPESWVADLLSLVYRGFFFSETLETYKVNICA